MLDTAHSESMFYDLTMTFIVSVDPSMFASAEWIKKKTAMAAGLLVIQAKLWGVFGFIILLHMNVSAGGFKPEGILYLWWMLLSQGGVDSAYQSSCCTVALIDSGIIVLFSFLGYTCLFVFLYFSLALYEY